MGPSKAPDKIQLCIQDPRLHDQHRIPKALLRFEHRIWSSSQALVGVAPKTKRMQSKTCRIYVQQSQVKCVQAHGSIQGKRGAGKEIQGMGTKSIPI